MNRPEAFVLAAGIAAALAPVALGTAETSMLAPAIGTPPAVVSRPWAVTA